MAWVLGLDKTTLGLAPSDVLVLLVLADVAEADGRNAFPSVDRMATQTGLSTRTIQRRLRALETSGLIAPGDPRKRDAYIERADRRPQVFDLATDGATPRRPDPATGRHHVGNGATPCRERGDTMSPEPSVEPSVEPSKAHASSDDDALMLGFDDFWAAYPPTNGVKRDRAAAVEQWKRLDIDDRRAAYRGACNKAVHFEATGEQPPYAVRFLRRRDFDDYQRQVRVDRYTGRVVAGDDPDEACTYCDQPPDDHRPVRCPNSPQFVGQETAR